MKNASNVLSIVHINHQRSQPTLLENGFPLSTVPTTISLVFAKVFL